MRSAFVNPFASLLGSLGLHCGVALLLLITVRHAARAPELTPARPDAWLGSAVEVDAIATPEATPSAPTAPSEATAAATNNAERGAVVPAPAALTPTSVMTGEQPHAPSTERPVPARPKISRVESGKAAAPTSKAARSGTEASSSASSAAPASGAFGGEGLPPGVRSLPSAFTRAIPPATGADPIWQTLPVGSQHPFTIAIEVDADGHISSAEISKEKDGSAPSTEATHLRERVIALLGGGLFALQNNVGAGRVAFRVSITLSDTPVHEEDDPAQLVERGFDPPRGTAPGRAYFTLASGRHFDAKVQVLARP